MDLTNLPKVDFLHNSNELLNLIKNNPELPIYFVTNDEDCIGDNVNTIMTFCTSYVTEMFTAIPPWSNDYYDYAKFYDDRIEFEEDLENYLIDENIDNCEELSDDDFDKLVKSYLATLEPYWQKVICIRIYNN